MRTPTVNLRVGNIDTARISVTLYPVAQAKLSMVSGNNQTGGIGVLLLSPLTVVLTENGVPAVGKVVTGGPRDVVIADMNRDGALDLLTANTAAGDVSLLLGNGDGTFAPEQRYGTAGSPVAAGDLDGDGLPDLVTADKLSVNGWSCFANLTR